MIVDEIHAVACTKRGAHLALTLERLDALAQEQRPGREVQRIGLSATQNPLEEVGRFMVGPRRRCRIVDTGVRKPLDLEDPRAGRVDGRAGRGGGTRSRTSTRSSGGTEATRSSIWPAIYPELLKESAAHRSTILFVNNRRSAERLALRLNELADADDRAAPTMARLRARSAASSRSC